MNKRGRSEPSVETEPPLLIFQVGVLGGAPWNFARLLAGEYGATFISVMELRRQHLRRSARLQPSDLEIIKDALSNQVSARLKRGGDVVLGDHYFHTAESRKLPLDMAADCGARTLALCLETPLEVVWRRVTTWQRQRKFLVDAARWQVAPLVHAATMHRTLEMPEPSEGIHHIFRLDGSGSIPALQDGFERCLREADLSGGGIE